MTDLSSLHLSAQEYHTHITSTTKQTYDKIVVGAAILHPSSPSSPKILLLKRNSTESYYPNVFEMPGGKVDPTDATIADAVTREVLEESGLRVKGFVAGLPPLVYMTEKTIKGDDGVERLVSKKCIQLNFVVGVDEVEFRVNLGEHSEGVWVSREEVTGLKMTEEMRRIVEIVLERASSYYH
jgi:8-oxo-dGTP pyrophosphatase MutT (NUDIX family)